MLQLNNNSYISPISPSERSGSPQYSRSLSPIRPISPRVHVNGAVKRDHIYSSSFPANKQKLYKVLYPYKPQQADELELISGDVLTVTMHCDDGWYVGSSTLTGQYGTFPGNYLEPLL